MSAAPPPLLGAGAQGAATPDSLWRHCIANMGQQTATAAHVCERVVGCHSTGACRATLPGVGIAWARASHACMHVLLRVPLPAGWAGGATHKPQPVRGRRQRVWMRPAKRCARSPTPPDDFRALLHATSKQRWEESSSSTNRRQQCFLACSYI
jgi:hypothetical protein